MEKENNDQRQSQDLAVKRTIGEWSGRIEEGNEQLWSWASLNKEVARQCEGDYFRISKTSTEKSLLSQGDTNRMQIYHECENVIKMTSNSKKEYKHLKGKKFE